MTPSCMLSNQRMIERRAGHKGRKYQEFGVRHIRLKMLINIQVEHSPRQVNSARNRGEPGVLGTYKVSQAM